MPPTPRLLVCECRYARALPRERLQAVLAGLSHSGRPFRAVADLCELAARRDAGLRDLAREEGLTIAACHPRAVKWLFDAAGAPLNASKVRFLNLRAEPARDVLRSLGIQPDGATAPTVESTVGSSTLDPDQHSPIAPPSAGPGLWFPVIDFDRCNQCLQCLDFCLFGVYAANQAGQITVQTPENCKPNCPACSRVCPQTAILFPKYKAGPINGGDTADPAAGFEQVKVDVSSVLGGDIYKALRERTRRSGPRFSPERDPETALKERRKYLALVENVEARPPKG